jgi:TolC family type I secretion outer membrane protein
MIGNVFVGASVLAVLVATSVPAHAQSLNDVLILAYRGNPDLTYQRAQVDGAKAQVAGARAPGLPQAVINGASGQTQLSLNQGGAGGGSDQDQSDSSLQLNLSQVLYAGGRISQDTRRAKANAQASEFDLVQTEQLVLGQAITAYVDILRDEAILSARNQNVEALLKQSAGVRARLREGEVTKTDVAQTEARLAQARSGAQAARANLSVSRAAFTRIVGQSPQSLPPAPPLPGVPLSAQEAELAAERDTPSVRAAQLRRSASEAAIRRAAAERLPYVTLDATAGHDQDRLSAGVSGLADSVQREDSYGLRVNVRVPLFQGGAASAGVRQARAVERGAQATEDGVMRQARETAANAWNRMQAADAIIDSSREQARAAEVAYRGGEYELNAGLRSTFDVLDLQQDVLSAQIAVASAERDAYVARVNLLQAAGRLTLAGLGVQADDTPVAPIARPLASQAVAPRSPTPVPAPAPAPAAATAQVASLKAAGSKAPSADELVVAAAAPKTPSAVLRDAAPMAAAAPSPRPEPILSSTTGSTAPPSSSMAATSPPRPTAQGPAPPSNACSVQAAAFGSEDVARQTRQAFELRFSPPSGSQWQVQTAQSNGQPTFRVLLVGLSGPGAARAACDRLGATGQACFVRASRCADQSSGPVGPRQTALAPAASLTRAQP